MATILVFWSCGDDFQAHECDASAAAWRCSESSLPMGVEDVQLSTERWPGNGREASGWPAAVMAEEADVESQFSVLIANLGNIDLFGCRDVDFNLCRLDSAEAIRDEIERMRPEMVLLSEVLTLEQCAALDDLGDNHLCAALAARETQPAMEAAVWLLGPAYDVACDSRNGYECVAVRRGRFVLEDCDGNEGWCGRVLPTPAAGEGCDDGFTVSSATVRRGELRFEVWNAHPQSGSREADQRCRASDFGAALRLRTEGGARTLDLAIFGGDMNMDPAQGRPGQPDFDLWDDHVAWRGEPRPWRMHSGPVERFPPWATSVTSTVLDHLLSTGFQGRCTTLGAAPGHPPLDRDTGPRGVRLDHLALYCLLSPP